jgi:hypothetical protein
MPNNATAERRVLDMRHILTPGPSGSAGTIFLRCFPTHHRIERTNALKSPPERANYSLTESASSPVQAEPSHYSAALAANVSTTAMFASNSCGNSCLFCKYCGLL